MAFNDHFKPSMIISSHTASMTRIKGKDGVLNLEIEVVGV